MNIGSDELSNAEDDSEDETELRSKTPTAKKRKKAPS